MPKSKEVREEDSSGYGTMMLWVLIPIALIAVTALRCIATVEQSVIPKYMFSIFS